MRNFITLPLAMLLYPLIVRNYRLRMLGLAPDEWYWADRLIVSIGWCVTFEHKLRTLRRATTEST